MKKRRASILFVIIACICASAATGLYFVFRTPPKEHYEQLQQGMSRAEVERILGGRPSEVHAGGNTWWYGTYGSIRAQFDENDKLAECILYPPPASPLVSFFERIEEAVRLRPNQNEFPSGGSYADQPDRPADMSYYPIRIKVSSNGKMIVARPLLIFETDGASSTRP